MKTVYTEYKEIHECQHVKKDKSITYLSLWAGNDIRFHICRLCSTVFLGAITSERIKEVAREKQETIMDTENNAPIS